ALNTSLANSVLKKVSTEAANIPATNRATEKSRASSRAHCHGSSSCQMLPITPTPAITAATSLSLHFALLSLFAAMTPPALTLSRQVEQKGSAFARAIMGRSSAATSRRRGRRRPGRIAHEQDRQAGPHHHRASVAHAQRPAPPHAKHAGPSCISPSPDRKSGLGVCMIVERSGTRAPVTQLIPRSSDKAPSEITHQRTS